MSDQTTAPRVEEYEPKPGDLATSVATQIRIELARRRISQAQLARSMGVPAQWMWRRLSEEVALDLNDLASICHVLDLNPVEMVKRGVEDWAAA